jgi:hypothetical protein
MPFVEACSLAARGIKDEESFSELASKLFRSSEHRLARSLPPCTPMHQHFCEVGAVRLVFGLIEDQLHGADYPRGIFHDE